MDEIDVKILKCLKANARENASVISDHVGMSVSAVIERIRKLEASGLIRKHTTIIDNKKAGKDITAFMFISLEHPKYIERINACLLYTSRSTSSSARRSKNSTEHERALCSPWGDT